LTRRLPIALVHRISALIFAVLGLLALALPSFKSGV
jgi:putative Ca2+/H+ antiporter (TMEM165/GDT1 family)